MSNSWQYNTKQIWKEGDAGSVSGSKTGLEQRSSIGLDVSLLTQYCDELRVTRNDERQRIQCLKEQSASHTRHLPWRCCFIAIAETTHHQNRTEQTGRCRHSLSHVPLWLMLPPMNTNIHQWTLEQEGNTLNIKHDNDITKFTIKQISSSLKGGTPMSLWGANAGESIAHIGRSTGRYNTLPWYLE